MRALLLLLFFSVAIATTDANALRLTSRWLLIPTDDDIAISGANIGHQRRIESHQLSDQESIGIYVENHYRLNVVRNQVQETSYYQPFTIVTLLCRN